jgi:hypothetical protein
VAERPQQDDLTLDRNALAPHVAAMNMAACNSFFGICREIICA